MNEAEKERLIKKDLVSIENKVRHAFNQGYEMGLKENKSGIVWNVVKAEIDAYLIKNEFGTAYRQEIADIINKHLQEVENG